MVRAHSSVDCEEPGSVSGPGKPASDLLKVHSIPEVDPEATPKSRHRHGCIPPRLADQVEEHERVWNIAWATSARKDGRECLSKKLEWYASD
jgi:hypothetical protein